MKIVIVGVVIMGGVQLLDAVIVEMCSCGCGHCGRCVAVGCGHCGKYVVVKCSHYGGV